MSVLLAEKRAGATGARDPSPALGQGLVCGATAGPRTRGKAGRKATCQLLAATAARHREALRLGSQVKTRQPESARRAAGPQLLGAREAAAWSPEGAARGVPRPPSASAAPRRLIVAPESRSPGRETSFHSGATARPLTPLRHGPGAGLGSWGQASFV